MVAILDPTRPGCEFDVYVDGKTGRVVRAPPYFDNVDRAQLANGGEIVDPHRGIKHVKLSERTTKEGVQFRYRTEAHQTGTL